MTALDVEVGRDYIVLARRPNGEPNGLRVGKVVGFAGNDRDRTVLVTLRRGQSTFRRDPAMVGVRYADASPPRRVSPNDIRRLATPREVAVMMPIHEVPGLETYIRHARRAGWRVSAVGGRCLCPNCVAKGKTRSSP